MGARPVDILHTGVAGQSIPRPDYTRGIISPRVRVSVRVRVNVRVRVRLGLGLVLGDQTIPGVKVA